METIIKYLSEISPVLITGIFTIYIAVYTYQKNRPLDKIEKSYEYIYYPLYKKMRNQTMEELVQEGFWDEIERIFLEYDIYLSQSTRNSYQYCIDLIEKGESNRKIKSAFVRFQNNIYYYNNSLRNKLGYPQADIIEAYRYMPKESKRIIKVCITFISIYIISLFYKWISFKELDYVITFLALYFIYGLLRIGIDEIINRFRRRT